jgi:SPP1 family predicted phage head-tail adaptor
MIAAGKLDRVITIQRAAVETVAPSGAVTPIWSDVATVRAEVLHRTSIEFIAAFGEAGKESAGFRIRYLAGLTVADRVIYAGQAFNLVELKEIGRREGLELRCEAVRK